MSNPTELPDLDKLELDMHKNPEAAFAILDPQQVLALIAIARRAQPEGEAVAQGRDAARYRYIATLQDWSEIEHLCRSSTASSAVQFKRDLDKLIDARLPAMRPEGEAPQAAPCAKVIVNNGNGTATIMLAPSADLKVGQSLYSVTGQPAAQHAESGERAVDGLAGAKWRIENILERGPSAPTEKDAREALAIIESALAAQS